MKKNQENFNNNITRREFIKTTTAVGMGSLISVNSFASTFNQNNSKKRYVIVGVGSDSHLCSPCVVRGTPRGLCWFRFG